MKPTIRLIAPLILIAFALQACAVGPMTAGPTMPALIGAGKSQTDYYSDDRRCRDRATMLAGNPAEAAQQSQIASTFFGLLFGAGLGAAAGAIGGDPGLGAAVGAAAGGLGGIAAGAQAGSSSAAAVQQRLDAEYYQCMYAAGHQVPGVAAPRSAPQYAPPPPPPPPSSQPSGSIFAPPPASAAPCEPTGKYVKTPQGFMPECK